MVSLKNYDREQVLKMPLIELAKVILLEEKQALKFSELFKRVADLKEFNEEERSSKISQFYTDLNADGSFVSNGSNTWGLKRWYMEEQKTTETTIKVNRKKRKVSRDEDFKGEFEDIDLSIDDIDEDYEDDEDVEFDFDDDFDEEFEDDFDDQSDEYDDK